MTEPTNKPSDWSMKQAQDCADTIDAALNHTPGHVPEKDLVTHYIATALDRVWEDRGGDDLVTIASICSEHSCHYGTRKLAFQCTCLSCFAKTALAKSKGESDVPNTPA